MSLLADDLLGIRERIKNEANWCQNFMALDADGRMTDSRSDEACKWCLLGAAMAHTGYAYGERIRRIEAAIVMSAGDLEIGEDNRRSMVHLNDTTDHTTVMRMINRAIKSVKQIEDCVT